MNPYATASFVRPARDIASGDAGPYARDTRYVERGFWAKARRLASRHRMVDVGFGMQEISWFDSPG